EAKLLFAGIIDNKRYWGSSCVTDFHRVIRQAKIHSNYRQDATELHMNEFGMLVEQIASKSFYTIKVNCKFFQYTSASDSGGAMAVARDDTTATTSKVQLLMDFGRKTPEKETFISIDSAFEGGWYVKR
ncbi:unnamed protein product, partial [Didymodactylos carnosus]